MPHHLVLFGKRGPKTLQVTLFLSLGPRTLTLWYQILGEEEREGWQQRNPKALDKAGGGEAQARGPQAWWGKSQEGGGVPQGGGREARPGKEGGGGAIRWSVGLSLRLGQHGEDVIRQLWAQPRRLCHPPRRPSIRQRLSGPFGEARQTAGPHA